MKDNREELEAPSHSQEQTENECLYSFVRPPLQFSCSLGLQFSRLGLPNSISPTQKIGDRQTCGPPCS